MMMFVFMELIVLVVVVGDGGSGCDSVDGRVLFFLYLIGFQKFNLF